MQLTLLFFSGYKYMYMATQVQFRRGTTGEHSSFTGAVGEVTVDTTLDTLRVHDGALAGGYRIAKFSDIPSTFSFTLEADDSAGDGGDAGGSVELAVEGAAGRAAGGLVGSAVGGAVGRSGAKLK